MNPYLAGFLLGVLLLTTVFISGRGMGATGAVKDAVIAAVGPVLPGQLASSGFFSTGITPANSWLVFQVIGLIIGAYLSGFLSGRLRFSIEKGPGIKNATRLMLAIAGGVLFGIGSQFGRGCTSGTALSGMAVFSTAGFVTMLAIFGTGYIIAYFFRKIWI